MRTRTRATRSTWLSALLANLILLSLGPLAGAQSSAPAGAASEAVVPKASEVIARYVQALGGEEVLKNQKSIKITGSIDLVSQGLSGPIEIYAAAPDKFLIKASIPNLGDVLQGFDGEVGWSDNPMTGPMLLEGNALGDFKREADFYAELKYDKYFPTMETVGEAEFDGKSCYKVRLVDTSDREFFQYFDSETGLMVGSEGEQATEMGNIFVTTILADYKRFGDVLMPTRTVQKMMGMEQTLTFDEAELDGVENAVFDLPASIQVLAKDSHGDRQKVE